MKRIITDVFSAQPGDLILYVNEVNTSLDRITLGIVVYVGENYIRALWPESDGSSLFESYIDTKIDPSAASRFTLNRHKQLKKRYILERLV